MTSQQKRIAKNRVNEALFAIKYRPNLPIAEIDEILSTSGFDATEPAIYCGREGRSNEAVGSGVYLTLSWYKMPVTDNYEIVAYVS